MGVYRGVLLGLGFSVWGSGVQGLGSKLFFRGYIGDYTGMLIGLIKFRL